MLKLIHILNLLIQFVYIANGNNIDFQSVYLDARCLATCSSEYSTIKPLENYKVNISNSPWPLFNGPYNEDILLCYYSCNQCDQEKDNQETLDCASSSFAPCVAGLLYCREDSFDYCNDSKPQIPIDTPTIKYSYTDFHTFEVSWLWSANISYLSTYECQSFTTFILKVQSFQTVLYFMALNYSTKIQLFNNLVNTYYDSFNISIGAVNKAGFSGFGPSNIFIQRDRDPGPVQNLRYTITENESYPDEYTVLLEWDIPDYNYENLYSFALSAEISPNNQLVKCEKFDFIQKNQNIRVDRFRTSYFFQHEEDSFGPISNCSYIFKIFSLVSIYNVSFTQKEIFLPYICKQHMEPFSLYFKYLPYDGLYDFVRIQGNWESIPNASVNYLLKFNIIFGGGSRISIRKETSSNSVEISSKDVAVENVFTPPVHINYEIEAHSLEHKECILASDTGQANLSDHLPSIPLNFSVFYNQSSTGFQQFHLYWDEPTDFGGPLVGYQIFLKAVLFKSLQQNSSINLTAKEDYASIVLENVTEVNFQVRAINIYGSGPFSDVVSIYFNISSISTLPTDAEITPYYTLGLLLIIISPLTLIFIIICPLIAIFFFWLVHLRKIQRMFLLHSFSKTSMDPFEIPMSQLHFLHQTLGRGAFGFVRKAIMKKSPKFSEIVAVKMTRDNVTEVEVNDLFQEIMIMKKIGNHPHIVKLLGYVIQVRPLCLILEYIPFGDLLTLLRKLRTEKVQTMTTGPTYIGWFGLLTLTDILDFAYQIADGMNYISSMGIIHRDLACRNILVAANKQLKISDFGLAREVERGFTTSDQDKDYYRIHFHKDKLPVRWMAIESITECIFTTKSDVWSYGIAIWEISSLGKTPYSCIPNSGFLQHLFAKNRPEIPSNCTPEIYELMRCCWHEDSQSRPSFCDLIKKIVAIRNLYNGGKTLSINSINCDQFISADLSGSFDWESSTPISPNKQTKSEHASMFPTNCRKDLKNITSENNECIDSSNSTASLMSANKSSQFYVSENESVIVNIKEQDQSVQIDSSVGYQVQGNPQSLVIHKDDLIEPSLNQIASLFHTSSIDNRNIITPDTKTDNLSSSSIFLQSHITKNVNDDTFIGNIFHESMTIADKQREKVQIDVDFKNNARCLETEL